MLSFLQPFLLNHLKLNLDVTDTNSWISMKKKKSLKTDKWCEECFCFLHRMNLSNWMMKEAFHIFTIQTNESHACGRLKIEDSNRSRLVNSKRRKSQQTSYWFIVHSTPISIASCYSFFACPCLDWSWVASNRPPFLPPLDFFNIYTHSVLFCQRKEITKLSTKLAPWEVSTSQVELYRKKKFKNFQFHFKSQPWTFFLWLILQFHFSYNLHRLKVS